MVVLLLGKLRDIWLHIEFLSMIKFFLLLFLDPVINRANFGIFLYDGSVDVMVDFGDLLRGGLR